MRPRDLRKIAAFLLCLLPAVSAAFDWTSRIGLLYDRSDSWTATTPRETVPRLDVDLSLDLRGDVVSPTLLAWSGGVGYRYDTTDFNGTRASASNALVYNANATLFGDRSSALTLAGSAARSNSRGESYFNTTGVADQVATSYGGTMDLKVSGLPRLSLGFSRMESEERLDSILNHERSMKLMTGGMSHGAGAFSYNATYTGEFSDGSWVADQYATHQVSVGAVSSLDPERDISVNDSYYRRIPSTGASGSFRSEINAFRAAYRGGLTPGQIGLLTYSDQRAVTVSGPLSEESLANSLNYQQDVRLPSPEYFLRGIADVSMTEQGRSDAGTLRSRGATLGAELWWRRFSWTGVKLEPGRYGSRLYEIGGGPVVALLDTPGEPTQVGYGASAHATLAVPWRNRQVAASYNVSYGANAFGQPGWTLSQTGNGTVSGPAGIGGYTAGLSLSGQRFSSPVLGAGASRSMAAHANYSWLRYSVGGHASLSEGILPGTSAFLGDGLFIPVGFDTRQTSVSVEGTASFGSLTARAKGGYTDSVGPGQPSSSAYDAGGALSYRFAAFNVSVEDRITLYRQSGAEINRNEVFVRLSRTFGGGY